MTREGEAEFSNVFTGVSAIGRSTNFTADGQILDVRSLLAKQKRRSESGRGATAPRPGQRPEAPRVSVPAAGLCRASRPVVGAVWLVRKLDEVLSFRVVVGAVCVWRSLSTTTPPSSFLVLALVRSSRLFDQTKKGKVNLASGLSLKSYSSGG